MQLLANSSYSGEPIVFDTILAALLQMHFHFKLDLQ